MMAAKFPLLSLAFSVFGILAFSCIGYTRGELDVPHRLLRNDFQGKELRVVTGHFPPVVSILRNSSGHIVGYSGLLYEQLLYFTKKLKFTCRIFIAVENVNGVLRNGTLSGMAEAVARNEADISLVPTAISLERRVQGLDFCGMVGGDATCILVNYPEGSVSFTSAFDVFSTGIWIGWIISGAAIVATSVVLGYLARRSWINDRQISAGTIAWHLFGVIISQAGYFPHCRSSQKLLLTTWCFVAFIFVNIYNSTLTSYMSVTFQRPQINSLKDLASNPSYKATILFGSTQELDLQRSKDETKKIIADRIQKCSSSCKKFNIQELVSAVVEKDSRFVAILPCSIGISSLKNYNAKEKKCRLTMAHEIKSWRPMFYAVPRPSPFFEEINREALWFINVGLRDYWYREHENQPEKCKLQYNSKGVSTKRSSNRIKLEQFYLPFLILFSGYLLAFIQLCREKLCHRLSA